MKKINGLILRLASIGIIAFVLFYANRHTDRDTHGYANRHADCDTHGYADRQSDCNPNGDSDGHSDGNSYSNANAGLGV